MVVGRTIIKQAGNPFNERCMPIEQAFEQGSRYEGIVPTITYVRARAADQSINVANIRVADQSVSLEHSGCIPEHQSSEESTRLVAVKCPDEVSQRCGSCILRLGDFQNVVESLVSESQIVFPYAR